SRLAQEACRVEIDVLKKPIGKQDQYAAAYGGLNFMRFSCDGSVDVRPVACRADTMAELERQMLMLYTGQQRDANEVLAQQRKVIPAIAATLRRMRDLAQTMCEILSG